MTQPSDILDLEQIERVSVLSGHSAQYQHLGLKEGLQTTHTFKEVPLCVQTTPR